MRIMEKFLVEEALYIIQLKIAKEIKENRILVFNEIKNKINDLQKEKEKIYQGDIKTINKVLSKYLNEVKQRNKK